MKNKLKSAKISSKTARLSQYEIQSAASKAARRIAGAIGIVLYDWNTDQTIADFDLTAEEFSRIQKAVAGRAKVPIEGRNLSGFIREALLENANRELFPGSPMADLEDAVARANGLMRLALEHQSFKEEEDKSDYGMRCSQELVHLCHSTTDRLLSAFEAALSYASGKAAQPTDQRRAA